MGKILAMAIIVLMLLLFLWCSPAARSEFDYASFDRKLKYAASEIDARRFDTAIGTLQELAPYCRSNKDAFMVNALLAQAYKMKGDFKDAEPPVIRALMLAANSSGANFLAGEIYDGLGKPEQAKVFYARSGRTPSTIGQVAISRLSQSRFKIIDLGCWSKERMPLRVYIDDGSAVEGYEPGLRKDVIDALDKWSKASGGKITFTVLPRGNCEGRDVRADLENKAKVPPRDIHIHWRPLFVLVGKEPLGITYPKIDRINKIDTISCADIYIATNETVDGKTYTSAHAVHYADDKAVHRRALRHVILHEMGHALGLGHSNVRSDIMAPVVFGGISMDVASEESPTSGDISHINALLQRVWVSNLPVNDRPTPFSFGQTPVSKTAASHTAEPVHTAPADDSMEIARLNNEAIRALNQGDLKQSVAKFIAVLNHESTNNLAKTGLSSALDRYATTCDGQTAISVLRRSLFANRDNAQAREDLRKAILAAGMPADTADDRRKLADKELANNHPLDVNAMHLARIN